MKPFRLFGLSCLLLVLSLSLTLGCGPEVATPGSETSTSSESGTSQEKSDTEPASKDDSTGGEPSTSEQPTTDSGASSEPSTPDDSVQDNSDPGEQGGSSETASPDEQPEDSSDSSTQEVGPGQDAEPDTSEPQETKPEGSPESKTPLCESKSGYCALGVGPCKTGYQNAGAPMECPGGRSALCCLPKPPPTCGKEGDTIKLGESCCQGLTKGSSASPPNCVGIGQTFVCVNCGDGKCDTANKENECSCPKDCKSSSTTCLSQGGTCQNSKLPCLPGTKADKNLTCGSLAQICCVKPSGTSCVTDKDCPPSCTGSGVCTQTTYSCVKGSCQSATKTSQPNAKCDSSTGQCVPLSPGCKVNCDCAQGLMCVFQGGMDSCVAATKPVYCCSKANCPAGSACTDVSGNKGTCPSAVTDCSKQGGYCSVQFSSCKSGYKLDTNVSCGAALSLQCCMPTTNKCATVKCAGPSCSLGSSGSCSLTSYKCNPATGVCDKSTKVTNPSCSMSGTSCVQKSPACSKNQCTETSQTVKRSCTQVGTSCIQTAPTCSSNTCTPATKTYANRTCTNGECVASSPKCKVDCDCAQGLSCTNGQCIAGFVPVYCCSKSGCPAGSACTDTGGNKGTCPQTATDCTKKGGYCTVQFTSCKSGYKLDTNVSCGSVRALQCCLPSVNKCATIKCSGPTCSTTQGVCSQTTYACDPAQGKCVGTAKKTASSCSMLGSSCVEQVAGCSANQCAVKTLTVMPTCRQIGTDCVQVTPTCASTSCSTRNQFVPMSKCNTQTGLCATQSLSCQQVGGTCVSTTQSCPRGLAEISALSCGVSKQKCCVPVP